jgi:ferric-dicitrate binding protein FerR (iron transport regulator)
MKTELENNIWDLMAKYFANECSNEEKKELQLWMNETIENEIIFFETQKNWEILNFKNTMKEVNVDNAWEKVKSRIEKEEENKTTEYITKSNVFYLSSFLKYAALGLILIGIGFVSTIIYKTNVSHKQIEYVANNTDRNEITLSDGTIVTLYPTSRLIYQKQFAANERKVKLQGEAFFNVAKDPQKPFIIEVQNTEVKVLGTSFNVSSSITNNQVEVFVETGLVQVTKKFGEDERVLIYPGEIVTVTDQQISHFKNTNDNIIAWKTKQITFKEESLNNVISTLNKVYNARISCVDSTILNQRFTSTFKDQTLDSVLSVICLAFDLKVIDDNGEIRIVQNNN